MARILIAEDEEALRALTARALSERWTAHPETVRETLRVWMSWWRDVMLADVDGYVWAVGVGIGSNEVRE